MLLPYEDKAKVQRLLDGDVVRDLEGWSYDWGQDSTGAIVMSCSSAL
jgi:hypothetical protein